MLTQRRNDLSTQSTATQENSTSTLVVTHFFRRWLWSGPERSLPESVAYQRRAYARATLIVRVFYALGLYWVTAAIQSWPDYRAAKTATPLWPVHWWFTHVSVQIGVDIIFCLYLAAALVVAVVPQRRWARIVYALALLEYMGFVNTPAKVNHDFHAWLFVSVVLVFLPDGPWHERRRAAHRQTFLDVFWVALLAVTLTYTLTGLWKVYDGLVALGGHRLSGFNVSGFSYIVGNRILQTNQATVLGNWFAAHPIPGWFMFLGTMYLESCSIIVAFRPRVHRIWGVGLILFHVGTQIAMGFTFGTNIVLVALLLACSPFAPDRVTVSAVVLDLPVMHFIARRVHDIRARTIERSSPATATSRAAP